MNIVDKGCGGVAKCPSKKSPVSNMELEEEEELQCINHEFLNGVSIFYNSAKFSDVTLVVGDNEFSAHKFLLSCVSPVFATMLDSQWEEGKGTTIVLQELPFCGKYFQLFLRYMYTGKVTINEASAKPLLLLADKYAVTSLQDLCSDYFRRHLSAATVLDVMAFAHKFQNSELLSRCLKYVAENADDVMCTAAWNDMDDNILILIVQRDDLQIWNEIELFSAVLKWVNADSKREALVPQIFHLLRFPLICYELLTHLVEPNLIFQRCPEIQYLLTEAYKYQLLPKEQRDKYFGNNIRVRPRQYNFVELGRYAFTIKNYSKIKSYTRLTTDTFSTATCMGGEPVPPPPSRPDGAPQEPPRWNWTLWVEPKGDADHDKSEAKSEERAVDLPFGLYLMPVKSMECEQRDIDCVFVAFGRDQDGQPFGHSLRDSYQYENNNCIGYGEPDLLKDENSSQSYIHNDEIDILVLIGYKPKSHEGAGGSGGRLGLSDAPSSTSRINSRNT